MIDLKTIEECTKTGYPHPCNSCYLCTTSGLKSEEDKMKCKDRIAYSGMIELGVRAYLKIVKFIEYCNYTWTVETLMDEYDKHLNNYYICYSANNCIKNNIEEFKILHAINGINQ